MAKAAKKKERRPPKGSQPASRLAAEAIRQLLRTRRQQAVLAKRSALLRKIIMAEGAGAAHGYRTYLRHTSATMRYVRVKERDDLVLVAYTEGCA